jgi:hypothetical protein
VVQNPKAQMTNSGQKAKRQNGKLRGFCADALSAYICINAHKRWNDRALKNVNIDILKDSMTG